METELLRHRRYSTARSIARVIGQHLQSAYAAELVRGKSGRVVGSLVCQNGSWRLSWFNGADRRLTSYAGPLDGDVEVLAESLSARLGAPVRLESQPV